MLISMSSFMPPRDPGDDGQPKMAEREAKRRNPNFRHGHQPPKGPRRLENGMIAFIAVAVVFLVAAFVVPALT